MDVRPAFIPEGQASVACQPREGPFDHPAVATKPLTGVSFLARDPDRDATPGQGLAATWDGIGRVGMQLGRALPGSASRSSDRLDGTASSSSANTMLSWRFAPVSRVARGMPWRTAITCRLVPGLPRSVGFGPTWSPPFLQGRWRCPDRLAPSRSDPPRRGGPAGSGAADPRSRPPVSRATAASRSRRSRSPSPGAASPRDCRS